MWGRILQECIHKLGLDISTLGCYETVAGRVVFHEGLISRYVGIQVVQSLRNSREGPREKGYQRCT